jgi:hypothetical protein
MSKRVYHPLNKTATATQPCTTSRSGFTPEAQAPHPFPISTPIKPNEREMPELPKAQRAIHSDDSKDRQNRVVFQLHQYLKMMYKAA